MGSPVCVARVNFGGCAPETLKFPCDDLALWARVEALSGVESLSDLEGGMAAYLHGRFSLGGLNQVLQSERGLERLFTGTILPFIIKEALALPGRRRHLPDDELKILQQGVEDQVRVPRSVGTSLLANMFLCTFDKGFQEMANREMHDPSFRQLHGSPHPQEQAKLRMFLNYFHRVLIEGGRLTGFIVIDRVTGVSFSESGWLLCDSPLLPMEVAPKFVGFETAPELAHVDFANMRIGGGVLSGGCVQEEIRFAICPELCLAILLCPRMRDDEAIQILGGEQFSRYQGFAFQLCYGGNYEDPASRDRDGTVQVSILAMDALDLRSMDASLKNQLHPKLLMRDLNKTKAAFTPVDEISLQCFGKVATGNWGCGAFRGCAPLKALLQWAAASQCRRQIRYFPFELDMGEPLQRFCEHLTANHVTVGQLLTGVWTLRANAEVVRGLEPGDDPERVFKCVADAISFRGIHGKDNSESPPHPPVGKKPRLF